MGEPTSICTYWYTLQHHSRDVALFFKVSVLESTLQDSWRDKGPNWGFVRHIKHTQMLNHSSKHDVAARGSCAILIVQYGGRTGREKHYETELGFHRKRFCFRVLNLLPISPYKDDPDAKIGQRPISIEVLQ